MLSQRAILLFTSIFYVSDVVINNFQREKYHKEIRNEFNKLNSNITELQQKYTNTK